MRNFNEIIDRRNTQSTKWDRFSAENTDTEIYPLWLADMDFPVSEAIEEALVKRARHPIYGYTDRTEQHYSIFSERLSKVHHYGIETEDVILSTGVMYSLAAAINLFTEPGDGILLPTPAYPPFSNVVTALGRTLLCVPMKIVDEKYVMDYKGMQSRTDRKTKAVILCNPHNPTGRVFTKKELVELADVCERNNLLIFADEIHCDLVYRPSVFIPVMNISEYTREHTIAMTAPTKTFNLAGLKISAVLIKNQKMNILFRDYAAITGISSINLFALEACRAAYMQSQEWEMELLHYLTENREFVYEYMRTYLPEIHSYRPEGTYFYWLDFRVADRALIHPELLEYGHVILNEGSTFAPEYLGFERLNIASPRVILEKALMWIQKTVKKGGAKK